MKTATAKDPLIEHMIGLEKFAQEYASLKLKKAKNLSSVSGIIRKLDVICDSESYKIYQIVQAAAERGELRSIDCKAGCSFCCHQPVSAMIPEILRVLQVVEENWTPEAVATLHLKIKDWMKATESYRAEGSLDHARLPCVFLEKNLCTIYEDRPFSCRRFNSVDVGVCQGLSEDTSRPFNAPANVPFMYPSRALMAGLTAAVNEHHLSDLLVDFISGLAFFTESPNAVEEYLAGSTAFAEVITPAT